VNRPSITCSTAREALSALLDGESIPLSRSIVDGHVAECRDCSAYSRELAAMTGRLRVRHLEAVPDLSASIVAALDETRPIDTTLGRRLLRRARHVSCWAAGARWSIPVISLAVALPAIAFGGVGHLVVVPSHHLSPCVQVLTHHAAHLASGRP
jgi:predicted anti-sigma-YlaC factor YlaD